MLSIAQCQISAYLFGAGHHATSPVITIHKDVRLDVPKTNAMNYE